MWSDVADPHWLAAFADRIEEMALGPPAVLARRGLPGEVDPRRWVRALRAEPDRGVVWLDGGIRERHLIAWDPLLTVEVVDRQVTLTGGGLRASFPGRAFDVIEALEQCFRGTGRRLFGYLGYELGGELEEIPAPARRDVQVPDLWLELHDTWVEVSKSRATLVSSRRQGTGEHIDALAEALAHASKVGASRERSRAAGAPSEIRVEPEDPEYEAAVARLVAAIHAGDLFQTNLCRRFTGPRLPSGAFYDALRATGDAAYGAWISRPGWDVFSRSPECYLKIRRGSVESRPIKGTRPRGASPENDLALRDELLASEKDGAELAMIVDLVRNDLGRVCRAGSVRVAEHRALMELASVWHTVSRVGANLGAELPSRLLRASFPPGSITGAPKIQAMVAAGAEEPTRRGPAMGAIGWIDPGGDMELSVAIRTAVADRERVVYHAGCGIVADSDPRLEREESLVKAGPFLNAFGP